MAEKLTLLSVDWDFFFPVPQYDDKFLYDWGHRETPLFMGPDLWYAREAAFISAGIPRPEVNDQWKDFWSRFTFSPDAWLFFGESHSWAASELVAQDVGRVWSYDAHHDLGYDAEAVDRTIFGSYSCDTWLLHYVMTKAEVHVRFPQWMRGYDWGEPARYPDSMDVDDDLVTTVIDRVFVCRSGAWVPPWCDHSYSEFVEACPVKADKRTDLEFFGWPSTPRDYDQSQTHEIAENFRSLRAR